MSDPIFPVDPAATGNVTPIVAVLAVEPKAGGLQLRNECTVEIEGEPKPACVAETITVLYGA